MDNVADTDGRGLEGIGSGGLPDRQPALGDDPHGRGGAAGIPLYPPGRKDFEAWRQVLDVRPDLEPSVCRMVDGLAHRVDRLRGLGNGVFPAVATLAWETLFGAHARHEQGR